MNPLVEAMLDAPADDAPRLVWADQQGGERSELVVIQCRLSARDADDHRVLRDRQERVRLVARERALLRANALAWSELTELAARRPPSRRS